MTKIAGSGSEFISQRYGSADLVLEPDPHQMLWICNTGWDSGKKLEGLNKKILKCEQMWALLYPKNTLVSWCKIKHMFYISVFITRITKVEPRH